MDAASQSAHPIVNTTLEQEVQTISRQLHAILVVKLDGKALGTVQAGWQGRRAGGMASSETGIRGQVWEQRSSVAQGILNTRAGWEADAREERSVVESMNRWEKTISLYRTASGVDISDGILAATVLEHNVRASYSAMRGWLREYAETLRRYDGTSGFSSLQIPSTGPVPMEVDQTRAVSGFPSG